MNIGFARHLIFLQGRRYAYLCYPLNQNDNVNISKKYGLDIQVLFKTVPMNCLFLFFIHLKLKLLTQFLASNE